MSKLYIAGVILLSLIFVQNNVSAQSSDLALTIKETSLAPYEPGQTVDFDITLYNQGSESVDWVSVVFYVPSNCTYNDNSIDFSYEPADGNAYSFEYYLAAGETETISVSIQINASYAGGILYPSAEIYEAYNDFSVFIDEDDDLSILQGSKDDDSELATNNDIDDEYPGTPGVVDSPNDIDDYDLEEIVVGYGTISGQVLEDIDGDGSGDIPLPGVSIEAYDGFAFPYNGVTDQNGVYSFTIYAGGFDFSILEVDKTGYISVLDVDGANDNLIEGQVLPNETITGLNFVDEQVQPDSDDFDLALTLKSIGPNLYSPGDTVSLELTIYNQGDIELDFADPILYIPTGMSFIVENGWTLYNVINARSTYGTISSGQSHTSIVRLVIDQNFTGTTIYPTAEIMLAYNTINQIDEDGDLNIDVGTNNDISEISSNNDIDDENPNFPGNADNPNDFDEYDVEVINVDQTPFWDLSFDLDGVFNDENGDNFAQAGETILFTATVTNTGNQPLDSIKIRDLNVNFDPNFKLIFSSKGPIYNLMSNQTDNTTYVCPYTLSIQDILNGSVSHRAEANAEYYHTLYEFDSVVRENQEVTVSYNSAPAALPDAMIETESGDVYISEAENGVILKSPSGNCYRIRIEDDGTLRSEPITCP